MIRVCLVEDHRSTREVYQKILAHAPDVTCLGAYGNAAQAERELAKVQPDVVLMDVNLPGRNGIDCVARLKRLYPTVEFVMLTTYDDTDMIFSALRAGASGYLLKRASPEELLTAIHEVYEGGSPMSGGIARRVVSHFRQQGQAASELETLTTREQEILAQLAKGLAYKQIAAQLGISPGTVQKHLHTIYGKLHVQSGTEAVVKFLGR
jgi:DNA-binding NarL/FixJ family response regulator